MIYQYFSGTLLVFVKVAITCYNYNWYDEYYYTLRGRKNAFQCLNLRCYSFGPSYTTYK